MDANRISFMDIEDEEEIEREYFLENDNENFGLSEEDLSLILTKSELPKHLFMLSCSSKSLQSSHGCSRICCESQTLEFEGKQKCKDCTIPEIIYRNKKGEVYLTELLQFARNKMELVPTKVDGAQNIFTCTCCNRQFTGSGMADKYKTYCKFCHDYAVKDVSSFTPKIQESGKELYEKYKQMLPISIRMMNLFKQKYCFEEVDIILFRLENEVYIVDKLELEEDGYLQNPIKVNIER